MAIHCPINQIARSDTIFVLAALVHGHTTRQITPRTKIAEAAGAARGQLMSRAANTHIHTYVGREQRVSAAGQVYVLSEIRTHRAATAKLLQPTPRESDLSTFSR